MKPPAGTRVPSVLAALKAACESALPAVQVILGPSTAESLEADVLWVAPGTQEDAGVVVSAPKARGLHASAYVENLTIVLNYLTSSGDTDMQARIDNAGAALDAVRDALDADPTVGGTVDLAYLGDEIFWHPIQHTNGASVGLGFTVVTRSNI